MTPQPGAASAKNAAPRIGITPLAAPIPGPAPVPPSPAAAEPAVPEASASEPLLFAVDSADGDRELTEQQIAAELVQGTVTPDTLVWRDGMAEWLEVKKVPELARHLKRAEVVKPSAKGIGAAASAGAAAPRFRPRQPTLPMGAIPNARDGAETPVSDVKAEAPAAPPTPARHLGTTVRQIPAPRPVFEPRATMPTPVPTDEEPTILRAPADMAALLQLHEEAQQPGRPTLPTHGPRDEETVPVPLSGAGRGRTGALPDLRRGKDQSSPVAAEAPSRLPWLDEAAVPAQHGQSPDFETSVNFATSMGGSGAGSSPEHAPVSAAVQQRVVSSDTFRETPEARRAWEEAANGSGQTASARTGQATAAHASQSAGPRPSAPLGSAPLASAPFPASFPATSDLEEMPFQPKRGKALWVVLVLLLLGGAAAGAYYVMNKRAAALPPLPAAPIAAAVPEPTSPAAVSSESAVSEPQTAEPTAARGGELPGAPAAGPANSAGGDFAQQFAAAAKHAADNGATDRFDPKAAKAALDGVTGAAARCREVGGPVGMTRVVVTFAPTGTVSSAIVSDAPLAGTSTGACIASALQKASVKPFSGAAGSITHKISIQ